MGLAFPSPSGLLFLTTESLHVCQHHNFHEAPFLLCLTAVVDTRLSEIILFFLDSHNRPNLLSSATTLPLERLSMYVFSHLSAQSFPSWKT